MLSFLPSPIIVFISLLSYIGSVSFLALIFFILWLLCLLTPVPSLRKKFYYLINHLPSLWSETIRFTMWLTVKTRFKVTGLEHLTKQHSYLVIANHQSWLDILVMQKVLDPYVPQLRYFMKSQLLWVPLVGQAAWLLGYPFMKRYTQAYLQQHPEDRGKDLTTMKKACERFRTMPVTLINYAEGTRFRPEKHRKQQSPYQYLLKPKAGGVAFVLAAMQEHISTILNITIVYSNRHPIISHFLQGKMREITVIIEPISVTPDLVGDYQNNPQFRQHFQNWLNDLWKKKDDMIKSIYSS